MALLEVRGLTAGYAGSAVLHGVDLTAGAAEVVAVLGRNGVGKSTLVNTVMGLVRPYSSPAPGWGWCRRGGGSSPR
jgi:branched-chain amino acid transport system ATP-binding protein